MKQTQSTSQLVRIFVSYSRNDITFASEIVAGLELAGFVVSIDREAIAEGEEWKTRLTTLIAEADTILFLLSRSSANSEMCSWEVDEAVALSKRIIPLLIEPLGEVEAPSKLSDLNYVRFDPDEEGRSRSFMSGLNRCIKAIKSDIMWLREHTRLLSRAREWDVAARSESRMLLGDDIAAAKNWVANRPIGAPQVTELQLDYIAQSERSENERRNLERKRLSEVAEAQTEKAHALGHVPIKGIPKIWLR